MIGVRFILLNMIFRGGEYSESDDGFVKITDLDYKNIAYSFRYWISRSDAFFGDKILSFRAICSSMILTMTFSITFFIAASIFTQFRWDNLFGASIESVNSLGRVFDHFYEIYFPVLGPYYAPIGFTIPKWISICTFLYIIMFSSFVDFCSVCQTRVLLRKISISSKSITIFFILFIDTVLTTILFIVGTVIFQVIYQSIIAILIPEYAIAVESVMNDIVKDEFRGWSLVDTSIYYLYIIWQHVLYFPNAYVFTIFTSTPFPVASVGDVWIISDFGIFVYPFTTFLISTYLTSIWIWLGGIATLVLLRVVRLSADREAYARNAKIKRNLHNFLNYGPLLAAVVGVLLFGLHELRN